MNKTFTATKIALIAVAIVLTGCTAKNQDTGYNTNVNNQEKAEAQRNQGNATSQPQMMANASDQGEKMDKDIALTVSAPGNNEKVTSATVTVKGQTVPNAEVFVNDIELKADAKGAFSTPVTLEEGDNVISVAANDEDGNAAEQELTVTYEQQ